jgi:hypothetical protein
MESIKKYRVKIFADIGGFFGFGSKKTIRTTHRGDYMYICREANLLEITFPNPPPLILPYCRNLLLRLQSLVSQSLTHRYFHHRIR